MRACRIASIACAITLVSAAAHAYVLPPDFIARGLAEQRRTANARDFLVRVTTIEQDSGASRDERLFFKHPQRLRIAQADNDAGAVFIQRDQAHSNTQGSDGTLRDGTAEGLLAQLLVPAGDDTSSSAERILSALKASGIDISVVNLGLHGETAAFVIGAYPWDSDKPQVWLSKNTFVPLQYHAQVRFKGGVVLALVKLIYEADNTSRASAFPNAIETYINGTLIRRSTVTKVQKQQAFPDALFEIARK